MSIAITARGKPTLFGIDGNGNRDVLLGSRAAELATSAIPLIVLTGTTHHLRPGESDRPPNVRHVTEKPSSPRELLTKTDELALLPTGTVRDRAAMPW